MNLSTKLTSGWTPQKIQHTVSKYELHPADVIRIRAKKLPLVDHYAVYLGFKNGEHQFAAAMIPEGVKILETKDFQKFGKSYAASSVRRFEGNYAQRQEALNRAYKELGKGYNPIGRNCENFANYVQTGKSWSQQTENVALATALGGGLVALFGKKDGVKIAGILLLVIALVALFADAFSTPKRENTRSFQWQT